MQGQLTLPESRGARYVEQDEPQGLSPQDNHEHSPVVWFADGASLERNLLTEPNRKFAPYPAHKIRVWDWSKANIRKESQGITREAATIQFNVIEELKKGDYDIIFADDDSGEAADVVTIRRW